MTTEKSREDRLRRTAERQGLRLAKCRRRDPRAIGFGTYMLVDQNNNIVAGDTQNGYGMDLDAIEKALKG
jgi:hypothetical protein